MIWTTSLSKLKRAAREKKLKKQMNYFGNKNYTSYENGK